MLAGEINYGVVTTIPLRGLREVDPVVGKPIIFPTYHQ